MSNRDNKIPCKYRSLSSCLKYVVAAPLFAITTQFAHALTDSELQTLLQSYEERIKALESELKSAPVKPASSPVYIQDLQKDVARIERQLSEKSESKLNVNGFVTAAATYSEDDLDRFGLEGETNFRGLSKAGIQLGYELNDRADATIQLVGRTADSGDDVWDVDVEWAYLSYELSDSTKVRAGRLRIPFYMFSETLDVGYTYPWVRPPLEVYRSPLTAYDGVDLLYDFKLGDVNNRLQFWTGSYKDTSGTDDLTLKDSYGLNLTSSWDDFTFRAMHYLITIDGSSEQSVTTVGGPPAGTLCFTPGVTNCSYYTGFVNFVPATFYDLTVDAEDDLDYSSIGFQWDNGKYFVVAETTDLKAQDGLFFTDEKSGYISAGTRINDWTPYATYGWAYSTNEKDYVNALGTGSVVCSGKTTAQACSSQSKSTSLGLRKELGSGLSLTMQWDHYYDFNMTNGFFGFNAAADWKDSDAYTISLDAVF